MQKLASLQLACKFLSCMGRSSQLPSIFTAPGLMISCYGPCFGRKAPVSIWCSMDVHRIQTYRFK